MTDAVKSFNLLIEHQCPQCGAPMVLSETDRLVGCTYCRVTSYLSADDIFRYVLPAGNTARVEKLVFVPYWRFKGMLFSCLLSGVIHRFVDLSHRAVSSEYFPDSLGFRSQALSLRFASAAIPGVFLKPDLSFDSVMKIFFKRFHPFLQEPVFHHAEIGETLSQVYSPFYVKDRIYDAILNQPVSPVLPASFDIARYPAESPDRRNRFIPALCPDCGWALSGERDALALACRNCHTVWQAVGDRFKKVAFAHIPGDKKNAYYLPFWKISADIRGIELQSVADMVRAANLPKIGRAEWLNRIFHFWIPGFKIRPQTFLRLSENLTLIQPDETPAVDLPEGTLHPVTLPLPEAEESLKIVLAGFIKPQRLFMPLLRDLTITPTSSLLVYIPFHVQPHEIVCSNYTLAINRSQMALAGNL